MKTTAEKAKLAGFASLKQAAAALDLTPATLRNWAKKHPGRFDAAIRGAADPKIAIRRGLHGTVFWDGGYISSDTVGLRGKHLDTQKRLIHAVMSCADAMIKSAGDELPIFYS